MAPPVGRVSSGQSRASSGRRVTLGSSRSPRRCCRYGSQTKARGYRRGDLRQRKGHARPSQQNQQGLYHFEAPIDASNVMLVDPSNGEPTKVGYRFTDSGEKVRVGKKSGKDIDG